MLLALAALLLVPAVVFAAPAKPSKPTASSSGGVMTVSWGVASEATSYQYRYSTSPTCLAIGVGCDTADVFEDWPGVGIGQSNISVDFSEANGNALAFGKTYFFQVRGYDGTDYGLPSDPFRWEVPRRSEAHQADRSQSHEGQRPGDSEMGRPE